MRIKMQQQVNHKTVEEAFNEFLRYCRVKNLAKDTLIFYENCFKSFSKFYSSQNPITSIIYSVIQDYTLYQTNSNITERGILMTTFFATRSATK